jgi:hypothetical protein
MVVAVKIAAAVAARAEMRRFSMARIVYPIDVGVSV